MTSPVFDFLSFVEIREPPMVLAHAPVPCFGCPSPAVVILCLVEKGLPAQCPLSANSSSIDCRLFVRG